MNDVFVQLEGGQVVLALDPAGTAITDLSTSYSVANGVLTIRAATAGTIGPIEYFVQTGGVPWLMLRPPYWAQRLNARRLQACSSPSTSLTKHATLAERLKEQLHWRAP